MPRRPPVPAPCPGCGGELAQWRTVPTSEPRLASAGYELWRCGACGTAVTGPARGDVTPDRPSEGLADLHASGSFRRRVPHLHRLARPVLGIFGRERLRLLARVSDPGSRVIDAGAGQGRFVADARAAGYVSWGFDPHPRGPDITPGELETVEVGAASADAVTLWHTLEHLEDPAAALERVHGWLASGGAVIVAVPNLASWQAQLGGGHWFHLDVPRHRTHFTPAGVERLLARTGFTVIAIEHRLLEHNSFGLWQTVLNRVGGRPSWLYSLLKGNASWEWRQAALCVVAVPMLPLAIVIEALAGARRHGGTVVVLARASGDRRGPRA